MNSLFFFTMSKRHLTECYFRLNIWCWFMLIHTLIKLTKIINQALNWWLNTPCCYLCLWIGNEIITRCTAISPHPFSKNRSTIKYTLCLLPLAEKIHDARTFLKGTKQKINGMGLNEASNIRKKPSLRITSSHKDKCLKSPVVLIFPHLVQGMLILKEEN